MKKSVVRKLVLLIGFSLLAAQVFAGSFYEGTGLEGKTFRLEEPVLSDYTGTTGNALITNLQSEIQNAFPQYTGMKLCTSNSEPADYIIMTVVQQNGNGSFLLTMSIMDPFTEATVSCSINNIPEEKDVYQHALANALLQLVPKLGIKLTSEGLSNLRSLGKIPTEKTTGTAGNKTADTKQAAGTEKSSKNSNTIRLDQDFDKFLYISGGYAFGEFLAPTFQEGFLLFFRDNQDGLLSTYLGANIIFNTTYTLCFNLNLYNEIKLFDRTCLFSPGFGLGLTLLSESATNKKHIEYINAGGNEDFQERESTVSVTGNLTFLIPLKDDLFLSLQNASILNTGNRIDSFILNQTSLGLLFCR